MPIFTVDSGLKFKILVTKDHKRGERVAEMRAASRAAEATSNTRNKQDSLIAHRQQNRSQDQY